MRRDFGYGVLDVARRTDGRGAGRRGTVEPRQQRVEPLFQPAEVFVAFGDGCGFGAFGAGKEIGQFVIQFAKRFVVARLGLAARDILEAGFQPAERAAQGLHLRACRLAQMGFEIGEAALDLRQHFGALAFGVVDARGDAAGEVVGHLVGHLGQRAGGARLGAFRAAFEGDHRLFQQGLGVLALEVRAPGVQAWGAGKSRLRSRRAAIRRGRGGTRRLESGPGLLRPAPWRARKRRRGSRPRARVTRALLSSGAIEDVVPVDLVGGGASGRAASARDGLILVVFVLFAFVGGVCAVLVRTRPAVVLGLGFAAQPGQLRRDGLEPFVGVEILVARSGFAGMFGDGAIHPLAQRNSVPARRLLRRFADVEIHALDAPGNRSAHCPNPVFPGRFRRVSRGGAPGGDRPCGARARPLSATFFF